MNNQSENTQQRFEAAIDAMRRAVVAARERLGSKLELTRTQLEILVLLADNSAQTTGELARRLFLTQSAVTQTIATLERRNLIDRRPDESDRRIVHLRLSQAGRKIIDRICAARSENMQKLYLQLTEAEINALITATEKLVALLEDDPITNKQ